MKKILMLLGLAGLLNAGLTRAQAPETAMVQQDSVIAVDTVLNGIRFIQSRDFEIYRGWTTGAAFNLSYADRPGDTTPYRLNITFAENKFTMKAGETKLMLKLKKAKTVLELINTKDIGPSDYRSEKTKDGTYYYITPSFAISETQIQQIAVDKVSKMRLIYDKGKFDREIENNAAVLGFRAASAAIQERLEVETVAEAKPEQEESYGYIVDEDDETYVKEGDGAEAVGTETVTETVETEAAVETAVEVETTGEAVERVEAVETVETTEAETVEEAVETEEAVTAAGETVETELEAAEEAVTTAEMEEAVETVEAEELAAETIVEETNETTEVTETVTDDTEIEAEAEADTETGSEETASESEN